MGPGEPSILTIREAATELGCSTRHVYRLIDSGELRAIDISLSEIRTKKRIMPSDLDAYLRRRRILTQIHRQRGRAG